MIPCRTLTRVRVRGRLKEEDNDIPQSVTHEGKIYPRGEKRISKANGLI